MMKMKISDIRKMSDKELNSFINKVSNNNGRVCCKCGKIVYKNERVTLMKNVDVASKKICCLCKDCYGDLLEYLGINDV